MKEVAKAAKQPRRQSEAPAAPVSVKAAQRVHRGRYSAP
jgi:hypothetical protein